MTALITPWTTITVEIKECCLKALVAYGVNTEVTCCSRDVTYSNVNTRQLSSLLKHGATYICQQE